MADFPKNHYEHKLNMVSYPFNLDEVLSDSDFKSNPERWNFMPGRQRFEQAYAGEGVYRNVLCDGACWFAWVCNRGGATAPRGTVMKWFSAAVTNHYATGGSTSRWRQAVGTFVDKENQHNVLHVLDDAAGSGAAPEGEWGRIRRAEFDSSDTYIDFLIQTARSNQKFSAAPVVNDDALILSRSQVIFATTEDLNHNLAGVVIRSGGIADNYWGWIALIDPGCEMVGVLVKAATGLTKDAAIKVADDANATAALSRVISGSAGDLVKGYLIGMALDTVSADIVSDLALCKLRPIGANEA